MEQFFAEHWQLVMIVNGALVSMLVFFIKREFNAVQLHQCKQDERLDQMDDDIQRLDRDLVDSKRDRLGLHSDIKEGISSIKEQLTLMNQSNVREHQAITQLIMKNGNGH